MRRFTETEKWEDPWYRRLSPLAKNFWCWLCDKCDCAGVIEPDYDLASFQIGAKIDGQLLDEFGDRVADIGHGKLMIVKFVGFQYGQLSPACKPHLKVLATLERHGVPTLSKGYPKGIKTLEEKEEEKDKDQERDCKGEKPNIRTQIEAIYSAYPRKVGRDSALKAIAKAAATVPPAELLAKTKAYAAAVATWPPGDRQFIPHPATWFNRGSYADDPAEWTRDSAAGSRPGSPTPANSAAPSRAYAQLPEPACDWRAAVAAEYGEIPDDCAWSSLPMEAQRDLLAIIDTQPKETTP